MALESCSSKPALDAGVEPAPAGEDETGLEVTVVWYGFTSKVCLRPSVVHAGCRMGSLPFGAGEVIDNREPRGFREIFGGT